LNRALAFDSVPLDDVLEYILVALNEGGAVHFPVRHLLIAVALNPFQQSLHKTLQSAFKADFLALHLL